MKSTLEELLPVIQYSWYH